MSFERWPRISLPCRRSVAGSRSHEWELDGALWRCSRCSLGAPGSLPADELDLTGCRGLPRLLRNFMPRQHGLGHTLQRCATNEGTDLFFCSKCGAWVLRKCIKLLLPCQAGGQAEDCRLDIAAENSMRQKAADTGQCISSGFACGKSAARRHSAAAESRSCISLVRPREWVAVGIGVRGASCVILSLGGDVTPMHL